MSRLPHWSFLLLAFGILAVLAAATLVISKNPGRSLAEAMRKPAEKTRRPMPPRLPDDWHDGGPYTGRITCLFSDGMDLFAGGWHMGVYRLEDGGRWARFDEGLSGARDVLTVARVGGRLFAGTFQGKLFVYAGDGWKLCVDIGDTDSAVRSVRGRGSDLLVSTDRGLYHSGDGGKTFEHIWAQAAVSDAAYVDFPKRSVLFAAPGLGIGGCEAGQTRCGLFGRYTGSPMVSAVVVDADEPDAAYVLTEDDGLYRTTDGRTFAHVDLGVPQPQVLAALADRRGRWVSIDGLGLLGRTPANPSWRPIPFRRPLTALARHGGVVYAGTDGLGVFALVGGRLEPRNAGLLNFPETAVTEVLKAESAAPTARP